MMLLVFAISISGVSNAFSPMMSMSNAAQTNAIQKNAIQTSDIQKNTTKAAATPLTDTDMIAQMDTSAEMSASHCQLGDATQTPTAVQASDHTLPQANTDAHCQISNAMDCQSCPLSLCQISFAWLQIEHFTTVLPLNYSQKSKFTSHYQAQHLAGFWQEILRPPKA